VLEEWVKHESEGYSPNAELPDYRKLGVAYKATFSGPFGSGINNAPIPPYLIEKFAGEQWSVFEMRHSVASVDELIEVGKEGSLQINASNLILLLQGKVYEGYACNSVTGTISKAALTELQNAVRTRVLELTLELEKSIPAAAEITLGPPASAPASKDTETVTQITQQIIHGNVTTISNTGDSANIQVNIFKGDETSLIKALVAAGIRKSDAAEFAEIISSEAPESSEEPFGKKAKAWIAKNIGKAMDGTWKIGIAIATQVLTEAALKYYGLK
jgi:AbiTii